MAYTYFANFFRFSIVSDSWAIKQLFPVIAIHRLNAAPTHHVRAGRHYRATRTEVDTFIDRRDVKRTLPIQSLTRPTTSESPDGALPGDPGRLHNLSAIPMPSPFSLDDNGKVVLEAVDQG